MAKGELGHFAIQCDDVLRARRFYEAVFGWRITAYRQESEGEFQQVATAQGRHIGAVQARKFNPAQEKVLGWECSVDVEDIEATTRAAETAGAKVLMRKAAIPGVGWVSKFLDTEGNPFCAVERNSSAR